MPNNIEFKVLADVNQMERSLASAAKRMKSFGRNMSTFVTLPLLAVGAGFIKLASDAEETANKFNVVFKDIQSDAKKWATDFGQSVGRSNEDMQRFSSTLGDILKPLGFATDEAFELSRGMTELALDVASFNNRQDADVIRAFASALTGERESLKTLGIVINETDVKQEALNSGIIQAGEELTRTAKAQATYNLLLKNSTDAQGDLARTQDSFVNQMKRMQASAKDLGVSMGEILLPAATNLIVKTNSLLQKFNDLSVGSQKTILALAGIAAIAGPLLFVLGHLITAFTSVAVVVKALAVFRLFGLATSVQVLAVNVGFLQTALLSVAGIGIAAFAGWKLGEKIAEVTGLDEAITKLAINMNLFGAKQAERDLAEADRLNKLAVERKRQYDAENADKNAQLEEQAMAQQEHEEEIKRLKEETTLFLKNNEDELRQIAEINTQEDINKLVLKFETERNSLIEHLNLKLSILKENGVLEAVEEEKIEKSKEKIRAKYAELVDKAGKQTTKNEKKTYEDRIESLGKFSDQTVGILREAGVQSKGIEIVNAIIQQKGALMKAWNSAPFPLNLGAVATTALQTGLILSIMKSASFATGTPDLPQDMTARVHRGEMIVPRTFSEAIRSGDLTLGGAGQDSGGGNSFNFDGAVFVGVTDEIVEEIFNKASEKIDNKTLVFSGA